MDALTLLQVLARRWYIVLPGLVLAGAVGFAVYQQLDTEYEASGQLLLTNQPTSGVGPPSDGDQVMEGDQDPVVAALSPAVVAEVVRGPQVRRGLEEEGYTADYSLQPIEGGIIRVTAMGDDREVVSETLMGVLNAIDSVVADREASSGVADVVVERLSVADVAEPSAVSDPEAEGEEGPDGFVAVASVLIQTETRQSQYGPSRFTADVLSRAVSSNAARAEIAAEGGRAFYEVSDQRQDSAPILYIDVTGNDPAGVLLTFDLVVERLSEELASRHAAVGDGASPPSVLEPLALPGGTLVVSGNQLRPVITAIGLTLIPVLTLTIVLDGVLTRHRRRRSVDDDVGPLSSADDVEEPSGFQLSQPSSEGSRSRT